MYAKKTRVPSSQTRAEIERLLHRAKARSYGTAVDHEKGLARVQFLLNNRIIRFSIEIPDPTQGKYRRPDVYEQAERQRWRALLLVIKAKLEAVESQITTFEEEFLAHVVLPNDQTVAQAMAPLIDRAYSTGQMPVALLPGAAGE